MGEKEIKPAGTSATPHTQERPGTGRPVAPPNDPPAPSKTPGGSSKPSGWSGSVDYGDGYQMGRDEDGNTWLQHPDGSRATWDPGSECWTGDDGTMKGGDWSGGHRPTDYGPKH